MTYTDGALQRITKAGTVTVTEHRTTCAGFEVRDAAGREAAILAAAWAIQTLQRQMVEMLEQPAGPARITADGKAPPTRAARRR